jgi:hypothetical protein
MLVEPLIQHGETLDVYVLNIWPNGFGLRETTEHIAYKDVGHFDRGVMTTTNCFSSKHGVITQLTRREAETLADHWALILECRVTLGN